MSSASTPFLRRLAPLAAVVAACALGGCQTDGRASMASLSAPGATLAFDSIDGPPQEVFDALLRTLDAEAQARNLAIVSRESPASFRLRGYYAAQVRRGQVTIAWVWDIYDGNEQREIRLSGEEPAGRAPRNAWAAANDQILRNIARQGLDGVAGLLGAPAAAPQPQVPASPAGGPAVAAREAPGVLAFRTN
jgi:hypothetical protein